MYKRVQKVISTMLVVVELVRGREVCATRRASELLLLYTATGTTHLQAARDDTGISTT